MKNLYKILFFTCVLLCNFSVFSNTSYTPKYHHNNLLDNKLPEKGKLTIEPTITVNETLTDFSTCLGSASSSQTFTVSGIDLTDNITITAPTNFEVSLGDSNWESAVKTDNPTSGVVAATTIYIRLKATATNSTSNQTISIRSTDATKDINTIAGTVNSLPPNITGVFKTCVGSSSNLTSENGGIWSSANTLIASVDTQGKVIGKAAGTTTIIYTNNNGCSVSQTFTVNSLPAVDFTFTDNQCSGTSVQFNTTGTGVTYTWNFGDGSSSTLQNPTHVFNNTNGNEAQSFSTTLTLTDANGCKNSITKLVSIKSPSTSLNSNAESGIYNGFPIFKVCTNNVSTIKFVNTSTTKSTNANYEINWGDSSDNYISDKFNVPESHTYSVGLWTLTYTITSNSGCSITREYKVFVGNNPAVGIVNPGNTNVCINTPLTFPITGTENNPPGTIYTVTFNDDSAPKIFNHPPPDSITHTFSKSSCGINSVSGSTTYKNSFSVSIEASNPCDTSSGLAVPIRVSTPPIVDFILPKPTICTDTKTCFTNSTTEGVTAGNNSCDPPKIIWTISPANGFTLNSGTLGSENGDLLDTNTWTSGSNSICPIFSKFGTYTITMKSGNGCDKNEISKTICVEPPLEPKFTLSTTEGCTPLTVSTTNNTDITNQCNTDTTYAWSVAYTSGYCGSGAAKWNYASGNATSENPKFNFETPGTYSIKLITKNSCGSVTSAIQKVVVKKPPTATINSIATICQTFPTTTINPTASVGDCGTTPPTYAWSFTGGIPATSTSADPGEISYDTPGTYTINLEVTNECGTTNATPIIVTIKPTPIIDDIPNQEKCKGEVSDAISFTGSLPGTAFNWTNSNTAIGLAANGTGNISPFTLTNTGTTVLTATITVTPTLNGCRGAYKTFTIKVNPLPTVPAVNSISYCQNATKIPLTPTVLANHTLNWYTTPTGGTPLAAAPTPNTDSAGTTTYYVSQTNNITGCEGSRAPLVVTINALPTVTVDSPEVCSDSSATVTATPGTTETYSYAWTVPTGATNPGNVGSFLTKIPGTYSVIITNKTTTCSSPSVSSIVKINTSPYLVITDPAAVCSPSTVDLTNSTITAGSDTGLDLTYWKNNTATTAVTNPSTISTSGTYYIKAENTNGCSDIKPVTVIVNPLPAVQTVSSISYCQNEVTSVINFTSNVTGTSFSWKNNDPSIGLSASGTGAIPSFTALNGGITPIIATITVTSTANGCIGADRIFTITVNPTPSVDQPTNQEVCNGLPTAAISFTGSITNTTYTWINSKPAIGLLASGTGDIPSFTALNTSTTPIVATITVTPTTNGCPGPSKTVKITVNPSPIVIFTPTTQAICSGGTSALVTLNSNTPGATFNWTATQPLGITEAIQTTGTNTIPAQTFTNTTNTDISVVYKAEATVAGGSACSGAVYTYTITVKPTPSITTPLAKTICSATSFSITPVNGSGNIVPTGTRYTWSAAVISTSGAITGGVAQNSPQASISQTLTNTTEQTATATYMVTPIAGTCSGTPFQVVITVNPSPKVTFSGSNQTICTGSTSSPINLSSPTTGNVTYSWTASAPLGITGIQTFGTDAIPVQTLTNSTTNPITVVYTATATVNTNGVSCSGSAFEYKITVNPSIITSSILSNFNGFNVSTAGASDGASDVTVTGGTGSYTYVWSGPNGFSATSQDISSVKAGAYTLIINDGSCDPVVLNFNLTEPMSLLIEEDISAHVDVLCYGYSTGEIKIDITQQSVGPYDYSLILQGAGTVKSSLSNAATNYTFTGVAAGTYNVTVQDANGSVKTITGITITEPPGMLISVLNSKNVTCYGNSDGLLAVSITGGTPPYTNITWTGPAGFTSNATSLTNLYAGNYQLSVTDSNNCTYSDTFSITEPDSLTSKGSANSNYNGQHISCFGASDGAILITTTGGTLPYSYSIDNGITYQPTGIFNNLKSGMYQFLVKDANNCTSNTSFELKEPTPIALTTTIMNVSCNGAANGQASVVASGGTGSYTYTWNTLPVQVTSTAVGLIPGSYQVTVTDLNGCSDSTTVAIIEPNPLTIDSLTVTSNFNGAPISCNGASNGEITVVATGGSAPLKYSIDNGASFQTTPIFNGLIAGNYTIRVVDANGCSAESTIELLEPEKIQLQVLDVYNPTCYGSPSGRLSVQITGGTPDSTGNYTYRWSNGATSLNQIDLLAGTYAITITDSNNCTEIYSVTITQPQELKFTYTKTAVLCFGENSGSITLNPTGGVPGYTYQWFKDGVEFTDDGTATNLESGIYEAIIKDQLGCYYSEKITVDTPTALTIKSFNYTDALNCTIINSGTAVVEAEGGTPFTNSLGHPYYTYNWSNGETNAQTNTLAPGNQWVKITDKNGCSVLQDFEIKRPDDLDFNIISSKTISCENKEVLHTFKIVPKGGVPPYMVVFSRGNVETDPFIMTTDTKGDVVITVTDSRNCNISNVVPVNFKVIGSPNFETNSFAYTNYDLYAINDEIKFNNLSTGDVMNVLWDFGDGSTSSETHPSHTYKQVGTYQVLLTVFYDYGCNYTYPVDLKISKGHEIIVPNGFTPNNDKINDSFRPAFAGMVTTLLEVYDTWGAMLYAEEGKTIKGWDGFIKNKPAENGNYFYRIITQPFNTSEPIVLNGPFTLIK